MRAAILLEIFLKTSPFFTKTVPVTAKPSVAKSPAQFGAGQGSGGKGECILV